MRSYRLFDKEVDVSTVSTVADVGGIAVPEIATQLFVGGRWHDASDGGTFDVVAPASEQPDGGTGPAEGARRRPTDPGGGPCHHDDFVPPHAPLLGC